jgi:hypothetical protein
VPREVEHAGQRGPAGGEVRPLLFHRHAASLTR